MPVEIPLEQRLSKLEAAVRDLQEVIQARKPSADWLDRVIGSMQDEPAFDEVLAYGRAFRQQEGPDEERTS